MKRIYISLLLSVLTGYISLSQELLWVRVFAYMTGTRPQVFAYVLGAFLFGVALGALIAPKICKKMNLHPLAFISILLFFSAVLYFISIPVIATVITQSTLFAAFLSLFFICAVAALNGAILPLLADFGISNDDSVGQSLSWIYFANIVGSTAGPLVTGFVLLNTFSHESLILQFSILTMLLSLVVSFMVPSWGFKPRWRWLSIGPAIILIIITYDLIYSEHLEKLQFKQKYTGEPFKQVFNNRHGIITVQGEEDGDDTVFGGGAYDGRMNLDPVNNSNNIKRAYMFATMHRRPKSFLEIGLSTGSWARVIADHSAVENLTIVEINPAYLALIQEYPEQATITRDSKINIVVDDGRRWLKANPNRKFDFILMNTSFHWRSNITNLLSSEFGRLAKAHLNPGGVLYYNTTSSKSVYYTAAKVFKYVIRYSNFVAGSDSPFDMTPEEKRNNLLAFENNGRTVFDLKNPELIQILEEMVAHNMTNQAPKILAQKDLWEITDDNMATEFKELNTLYNPSRNWGKLFFK